jgi:peptide/nickel transport system ATP-binding protein
MADAPVLSVRNLNTAFRVEGKWITVVKGISFDVKERETVAIVGESGSGKSVTALSIMRLLPAANSRATGEVLLDGRDLLKLQEEEMRHVRGNLISMIFQEPMTSLNPVLTLGFQISEALIYHRGLDRAQAEAETLRILERVRIPSAASRLHEYPHRLSGGMRQRVMIAMALACKPKLLIADEPTTALDVTIQAEILELIKLLQDEEGMSVIFITHDMGVVAEIADRVVVMLNGNAVEQEPTAQLFTAPREPYTRALLAAVPRLGSMKGRPSPQRFSIVDPVTGVRWSLPTPHRPRRSPSARCSRSRTSSRASISARACSAASARASTRSRTSRFRCTRAKRWRWSAKAAAVSRQRAVRSCGWSNRTREACCSRARTCARSIGWDCAPRAAGCR